MIFQPFLQDKKPYLKLLYFLIIVISCLFFINILGMLLGVPFFGKSFVESMSGLNDYTDPVVIAKLKYLQVVNQLALFIVPALIFALFADNSVPGYLKLNRRIKALPLLFAVCIIFAGLPLINWLSELNKNLSLSEKYSWLEQWMRDSETQASDITTAFLSSTSYGGLLINFLVIAILPALGEEFFFRGVLQRLFSEWFKNAHAGIIITALLFSTFHFQFFGFLPRFLLGMFLGYLFYWSGTLWLPIIVHFLNNGLAVAVAFLAAKGTANVSYETFGSSDNILVILSSGIIVAGMAFALYKTRRSKNELQQPEA
ncbi:MAG TPA: CPBP family intramembrane metalloprotease [Bacteroidales bacterium]|nr:CPBP family intramembrane metalloprotease [Bacteroidales bacterium]HNZ42070.1 CPBP family intramembrane metalloprotease [Bacteroidales bacterium]HOH83002.1 CPBP family intramembrane metalloprotease [Bacteroidales bacterium]HPI30632.1 CPBP family intramembrane metalloprotease [Bacteroidales bacterium]HQN16434.1 CPBP family intramembrane metalloprotease [Bacteroidales bacterium]